MSRLDEALTALRAARSPQTTSLVSVALRCPPDAARTALVRLVELGHARRYDDGTFEAYPVRQEVMDLLHHSGQEWTAYGVATELPHLNLSERDAAVLLNDLVQGEVLEAWYSRPGGAR